MSYTIAMEDVWVGELEDRPGDLARVLKPVSTAKVDLEFMIARRAHDKPGKTVLFVATERGEEAAQAAQRCGLHRWSNAASIRVDGPNQPGLAVTIGQALGDAGINMRGISGAKLGEQAQIHIAFDSSEDAEKASSALAAALNG
jgi:hypothetical protein